MQKRAAAYARYSTDKQTENSIAYQIGKITEYCSNNGIELCEIYTDEAMSGTNMNRPGFQRLMEDVKHRKFDAVVIYEISRGSRDIGDWFTFRHAMLQARVEVISVTERLGSMLDPNAFFMEAITAAKSQLDVLQIRERSIAGVAVKAKQGQFLGGYAPLGYDIVNGEYVINEYEATLVKKIFKMYADGASYKAITQAMNGAKGKRGRPLGKNGFYEILRNERYIGVYSWNKRNVKLLRKWAGGTPNPNAVRIEGAISPIIDIGTWEKVQKRMKNSTKGKNSAKRTYLLSGLIKCEACGATYCGHTTKNQKGYEHSSYVCCNKSRTRTCSNPNIPATELEAFVVQNIKNWLFNTDFTSVSEEIAQKANGASRDLTKEKKERADIETKLNNGVKAVLAGMNFPELEAEMNRLRDRAAELDNIISLASASHKHIEASHVSKVLNTAAANWSTEKIPDIIRTLVKKIDAHPDGTVSVEIGVYFDGCGSRI